MPMIFARGWLQYAAPAMLLAMLTASACDRAGEPPAAAPDGAGSPDTEVVARGRTAEITRAELDAPLRLKLHDLEWAAYELRSRRLQQLLARRAPGQAASVEAEILLDPPAPPRLEVPVDETRVRGDPRAAVTILEFIDYESANCRRMQPVLQRVLAAYEGNVRLAVLDFPQPFHRHAQLVAEAARCAGAQGDYWSFHDVALAEQDALGREDLLEHARRVGLDRERLAECLESGRFSDVIEIDRRLAEELGVSVAPTFFVDGLYLRGPQSFDAFAAVVDGELERKAESEGVTTSSLALSLVGTVVADDPARSLAAIRSDGDVRARLLHPGDEVLPGVRLIEVRRARAYLERDGRIEFLRLVGAEKKALVGGADAEIVLELARSGVHEGLRDRAALAALAAPAPLDLAGSRVLKLTNVPPGSLLERMGLRKRDVPMMVDDEMLLNDLTLLWDALETRDQLTLVVMRRGLPRRFHYRIR